MKIESKELADLIPQKSKMRLIEKITDCDLENWSITSETAITENCLFFDEKINGIPNYVLFEFAAQTIAALMGIKAKETNSAFKSGFILSVSNFKFDTDSVKKGENISVKAVRESELGNVHSFSAEFFVKSSKIGSGSLTVMQG